MTDLQKLRAIALKGCRLGTGASRETDFAEDMVRIAQNAPDRALTQRQAAWLEKLTWRYREQLKTSGFGHVVPAQSPFDQDNHYTTDSYEHPTHD